MALCAAALSACHKDEAAPTCDVTWTSGTLAFRDASADWGIVDIAASSMVIEITGTTEKIDTFVELMRPYGITEMARSGAVALVRGDQAGIRLADLGLEAEPPGGSRVGAGAADAGITADTTGDI